MLDVTDPEELELAAARAVVDAVKPLRRYFEGNYINDYQEAKNRLFEALDRYEALT